MDLNEYITHDKDGNVRLPVGYRFDPTDDVIISFYLKKKIQGEPLTPGIVQDVDVFETEPWRLPGGDGRVFRERMRYFFFNTKDRPLENRVVGCGQWRKSERVKEIPFPDNNKMVGKRVTMAFWEIQGNHANRTRWMMHEFRLSLKDDPSKISNWAMYRIFQKKKGKRAKGEPSTSTTPTVIDFMEDFPKRGDSASGPPSPKSP